MKNIKIISGLILLAFLVVFTSCTNLDSKILDGKIANAGGGGSVDPAAVLQSAYESWYLETITCTHMESYTSICNKYMEWFVKWCI